MSKGFTKGEDSHKPLDINDYLVQHPSSTFYMQSEGDGPEDSGIIAGDMLAVDKSKKPKRGDVVVHTVDGEMELAWYRETSEAVVWGTVIGIVRKF